ncbi:hypothetical protein Phou_087100 [Phytohabitans houttuyneae]|uniref:Lipoprotein n=1 Tax=Phytohabitans houttuyneae TaxID=1076126 RepID=A0A6V8KM93_9ACTN|nr:hypothetical protein Phou_087100 [Phytohabitans houttuyneae]
MLLAGCGGDTPAASTPSTPPASPSASPESAATTIQRALERSFATTFTLRTSIRSKGARINMDAQIDPVGRVFWATGNLPGPTEMRQLGETMYLKSDLVKGGRTWLSIDIRRLGPDSSLRRTFDPEAQAGLLGGIVSAESLGGGRYKGTADLTKAAGTAGPGSSAANNLEDILRVAADPGRVPFEVRLEPGGRLTLFTYTLATKDGGDMVGELVIGGFGVAVNVDPPPEEDTEEASPAMYDAL